MQYLKVYIPTIFLLLVCLGCGESKETEVQFPLSEETYTSLRQDWVKQDKALHFASQVKLSIDEKTLDSRLEDLKSALKAQYDEHHFFPPARSFYLSAQHIPQTDLFALLRRMPKGGLLHIHDTALGSARHIVQTAIQMEHCYVFWQEDSDAYVKGQLQFFKPEDVPEGFEKVSRLAETEAGFEDKLHRLLTFDQEIMQDSVDVWGHFEKQFQRRLGFINYQPIFRDHFIAAFDSLQADGISYVELRVILHDGIYDLEHPAGYYPADSMLTYYREVLADCQQNNPDFQLKIIYTGLRFFDKTTICSDLDRAYQLKKSNEDLLVGYDLVGKEDGGFPTLYHLSCWLNMDSLSRAHGTDMPLFLHDGESNLPNNDNLYDALLLQTRRIGHGFNLFRYPNLEAKVKSQNICMELCPLSNQILGYIGDLRNHPAVGYLNRGLPCVLSSDDPSIFNYEGLSYDFWAASLAWDLNLASLKQLAQNSITYSSLSDSEKKKALKAWEDDWKTWVLAELGM